MQNLKKNCTYFRKPYVRIEEDKLNMPKKQEKSAANIAGTLIGRGHFALVHCKILLG